MNFCINCKHHRTVHTDNWRQFLCASPNLLDPVTGKRYEMECHEARDKLCDGTIWYEDKVREKVVAFKKVVSNEEN